MRTTLGVIALLLAMPALAQEDFYALDRDTPFDDTRHARDMRRTTVLER